MENSSKSDNDHTVTPLRMDALNQSANHTHGPKEGAEEHASPQAMMKFSQRTPLGEMMFAHVSCQPDTGHAITLVSKCGSNPTDFHCSCLKSTAEHLGATKHWELHFTGSGIYLTSPMNPCLKSKSLCKNCPNA